VVFIRTGSARPLRIGAPPLLSASLLNLLRGPTEREQCSGARAPAPAGVLRWSVRARGGGEVKCHPLAPGGGDSRSAGLVPIALVWADGLKER